VSPKVHSKIFTEVRRRARRRRRPTVPVKQAPHAGVRLAFSDCREELRYPVKEPARL
jgi:hypothetical protein